MYPRKKLAQMIVAACQRFEIQTIVISPGSRNAPLTIGFYNHQDFETISIVDERCAAFFALGIAQQWNSSKKKMILVGVHPPNKALKSLLYKLADDPSVLILTETTSNLNSERFINSIDTLIFNLTDQEFKSLQPQILLTFGGLIVSKKIKKFLRDYSPEEHWHVNELRAFDTYHVLSKHLKIDSQLFFEHFSKLVVYRHDSTYEPTWTQRKHSIRKKHNQSIKSAPFSDLKVFDRILDAIPHFSSIQLSIISIIRYSQLFRINRTVTVFCNRGTSGIDGCTSRAIGAAYASEKQTTPIYRRLEFFL